MIGLKLTVYRLEFKKGVLEMNKKLMQSVVLLGLIMMVGCSQTTVDTVTQEVNDQIQNQVQKDNVYIEMVKNGYNTAYPEKTYGEAFEAFFSNPTWKYFEAETGETVVEFTGGCMYLDAEVKARLQFILDIEAGSFEVGALSFNDVPQMELITAGLLSSIFEEGQEQDVLEDSSVNTDNNLEEEIIYDDVPEGGGVKADDYWEDEVIYDDVPEGGGVKADDYWEDEIIYDDVPEGGGVKADDYWEDEVIYDDVPEGGGVKADDYWEDEVIYDDVPEGGGVKADDYWN